MKVTNWQLFALITGAFVAVIAVDIFIQYQSDTTFRDNFPKLPTAIFAKSRAVEMVSQEMAPVIHNTPPTFAQDEDETNEDS